jgi:CRP-like cAMP-binding protein
MEHYFEIISQCPLFKNIEKNELPVMLDCLDGRINEISKGETIFLEGDSARFVGVVLDGAVQISRDDYYGNRSVLTILHPGELFAEVFACAGLDTLPVSAISVKSGAVLLLDCKRVLSVCSNTCRFHSQLIENLLQIIARKNMALNQKIQFMSQKKTQEKLMAYLLEEAKRHGRPDFTIPYDRQSLADYLGVERSAMSAEISKMKKAGLIDSRGSWFHIYTKKLPPYEF